MTPEDVVDVLAKCAAFDQRTVGEADVLAWHEILHRIERQDGLAAVTRHYAESSERAMPAHILRHARAARDARKRIEHRPAPLALPSRFEEDVQRDARLQVGVQRARGVLEAVVERLKPS